MKKTTIVISILILINIASVIYIIIPKGYSQEDYIRLHYESEAATLVSPHSLREMMEHGDDSFIVVDTRNVEDYEEEHIIGSVNIPGYSDEEKLVKAYRLLMEQYPGKDVIIYCYTEVCMRGRKVGRILARNNIFVQELGIGFNEWKNYWKKWNYEHEWPDVDMNELIEKGKGRSIDTQEQGASCSLEGTLSC